MQKSRLQSLALILIFSLALPLSTSFTANAKKTKIPNIYNVNVTRIENTVSVQFTVGDLKPYKKQNILVFTPTITKCSRKETLQHLCLASRRNYKRSKLGKINIPEDVVFAKYTPSVDYQFSVPYKLWMRNSSLKINIQRDSDYGYVRPVADIFAASNILESSDPLETSLFLMEYVTPELEIQKQREFTNKANIQFQDGKSTLVYDFRNNQQELMKIYGDLNNVINNQYKTLNSIDLLGTCSPEGGFQTNAILAQKRVESVKSFLTSNCNIDPEKIRTWSTPENWIGLQKILETRESKITIPSYNQLTAIVNDKYTTPDQKDRKIAELSQGITFRYLLEYVYPQLRQVEYTLHYTIPQFTITQTEQVIGTNPELVSLNEIFQVAMKYKDNPVKFAEYIELGVKLFPAAPTANLNMAILLLRNNEPTKAIKYLEKLAADTSDSPELANALGIYQASQGDLLKAQEYFKKASQDGLIEAIENLRTINDVF